MSLKYPKIILNPIYRAHADDGDVMDSRSLVDLMKWAQVKKTKTLALIKISDDGTTDMKVHFVYALVNGRLIRTV